MGDCQDIESCLYVGNFVPFYVWPQKSIYIVTCSPLKSKGFYFFNQEVTSTFKKVWLRAYKASLRYKRFNIIFGLKIFQIGRSQTSWFFISTVCGGFSHKNLVPHCLYILHLIVSLNCLELIKLIIPNIFQGFHKRCISIYSFLDFILLSLIDLLGLLLRLLGWLSLLLWLLSL